MYSLAVSLQLLACLGASQTPDVQAASWSRVSRSLVSIRAANGKTGYGVLIDRHGLFLAHASLVVTDQVFGKLYTGTPVVLNVVFTDGPTQLTLLESRTFLDLDIPVVEVASTKDVLGKPVFAALAGGPVSGEFVSTDRPGIMKPSLRYVPLSEIRFETLNTQIGGSLVFTSQGKLAGVLSATLAPVGTPLGGSPPGVAGGLGGGGGGAMTRAAPGRAAKSGVSMMQQFGPVGMTVSYSLGTDVLQRVVKGFASPRRRPEHPTIGVFFRDSAERGAVVEGLRSGSTAEKAGIRQGDVILEVNGREVLDAFELAALLFRQNVGSTLKIVLRRRGEKEPITLDVLVGKQDEGSANNRQIFEVPLKKPATVK